MLYQTFSTNIDLETFYKNYQNGRDILHSQNLINMKKQKLFQVKDYNNLQMEVYHF